MSTATPFSLFPIMTGIEADNTKSVDITRNGVGLSDPMLSRKRKDMLDMVNRLRSTGVEGDLDLPTIAVLGSQSAGKSSLIESFSGITLPRAAGTCTRCPMECKLAYADEPWRCIVSLRFLTDSSGSPVGEVREVRFGPPITDKREVEDRIRRAQRAILSPATPHAQFLRPTSSAGSDSLSDSDDLPNAAAERSSLRFSKNCISLAITGNDVVDLSFVDLPGLIATAGKGGSASDVQLVKALAESYIEKPSCLILLTVTCETDFQNQGAFELAKLHDKEGRRTIGVLTKPDRIPEGEETLWLKFIRNEAEPLVNNWFCVRLPDSKALASGTSWAGARRAEDEFFSMTKPWSGLEVTWQKYLRTSNLVKRLSELLGELMATRLPKLYDELSSLTDDTTALLSSLPLAPSADAVSSVLQILGNFSRNLSLRLLGNPEENSVMQAIRPAHGRFRRAIRTTAPEFRPWKRVTGVVKAMPEMSFLKGEIEEEHEDVKIENKSEERARQKKTPASITTKPMYIDEVFNIMQTSLARELPSNYPFSVLITFIAQFRKKWQEPVLALYEDILAILRDMLDEMIEEHFQHVGQGIMMQKARIVLHDHLAACCTRTREKVDWLLALEEHPFTLNQHYYEDYYDKFFAFYKGCRDQKTNSNLMSTTQNSTYHPRSDDSLNKINAALAEIGMNSVELEDLGKLLPPDPMEPALRFMAHIRAYFQVAYKRIIDLVPMAIDRELVLGLGRDVEQALQKGLAVTGPDGYQECVTLIQESPSMSARREDLESRLERLRAAAGEMRRFAI